MCFSWAIDDECWFCIQQAEWLGVRRTDKFNLCNSVKARQLLIIIIFSQSIKCHSDSQICFLHRSVEVHTVSPIQFLFLVLTGRFFPVMWTWNLGRKIKWNQPTKISMGSCSLLQPHFSKGSSQLCCYAYLSLGLSQNWAGEKKLHLGISPTQGLDLLLAWAEGRWLISIPTSC